MINQVQMSKMEAIEAMCGEHFSDYLIIVRPDSKGLAWRSSNTTWGIGAASRYIHGVATADMLEQSDEYRGG